MAIIRFEPNVPVEVALKYDQGKEVESRIADAPNQMMYTICGGDTIYVPLAVAGMIDKLGIKREELMSICKRVQGRATKWEVKRISEAPEPRSRVDQMIDAAVPAIKELGRSFDSLPTSIDATPLERKLTDSINQQRQANPSKSSPAAATVPAKIQTPTPAPNSTHIHHTTYSRTMAASLIAAIDAAREAERYAAAVGFEVEFVTEDIRMMAATLFIAASKDPAFLSQPTQKVNGGTKWPA
jgi:hypothetical protein